MISIKGLNKFFNKGKQNEIHVINNVTLDLPERGITAIFGKSGCGKTTLLNVIGGLDKFSGGSLCIEGQDIAKNTDEIRNKYIGYIFQNYNLSQGETCYDNVAAALRLCGMKDEAEIERRVAIALKNVGMEQYAKRTPDTLSGGQQQRIAIARAIVKNPPVILADEPTGNLDEANTILIMDLLREIAKDHLVILVTHEQSLVDAYCDTIIELSDGKIISTREGRADGIISSRNKQDIYLGDLERHDITTNEIMLEYYGDAPETPIDFKIVNKNGRLYLKLGSEKVHIIDGTGEVRLLDGKYQDNAASKEKIFDMTELSNVEGEHYGRLFSLVSSLKSAYHIHKGNKRRGKKALSRVMIMFAAVTVVVSAVFGSSIGKMIDADNAYNHNTFYVYTEEGDTEIFEAALSDPSSGIDSYAVHPYFPSGDHTLYFRMASFDTFTQQGYVSSLESHGVILDSKLADGLNILAGSRELPSDEYILVSEKVAADIIETSGMGFVDEYADVVGMTCNLFVYGNKPLRIGGVVESGEHAVYLTELAAARFTLQSSSSTRVQLASDFGISLQKGEAVVTIVADGLKDKAPEIGDKIDLRGLSITVKDVITRDEGYIKWASFKMSREEYFAANLPEGADLAEYTNQHYFEYDEYFYDALDEFLRDRYILDSHDFELWLYCVKGETEIIRSMNISTELCKAENYKAENGRYPTKSEYDEIHNDIPDVSWKELERLSRLYYQEFENSYRPSLYRSTCLVSEEDYIEISRSYGNTHSLFVNTSDKFVYTQVHSSNPALTETFLNEKFGDREIEYYNSIITPKIVLATLIAYQQVDLISYLIALVVILLVMSVCMYFIMRSSMMSRIKEIGIYRAIGVSRRNIILRFGAEAALLTANTVVVGYLASSLFIRFLEHISPNASEIFYYPLWYSLIILAILCGLALFCGIVPVMMLLRKTPSEILAKYDV